MADLRRSELRRLPHLEPSDIFAHLYRISTEHNSNDAKRLFLQAFPAYPEIISHSIRRIDQDESAGLLAHSLAARARALRRSAINFPRGHSTGRLSVDLHAIMNRPGLTHMRHSRPAASRQSNQLVSARAH
jgi:hypothetical protein